MTSSNTLKKLVSTGAAMLLAVGGSLVAAEPASAANPAQPVISVGGATVTMMSATSTTISETATFTETAAASYDSADTAGTDKSYWILCADDFNGVNNWSTLNTLVTAGQLGGTFAHDCRYPAPTSSASASTDAFDTATTIDLSAVTHLVTGSGTATALSGGLVASGYRYLLRASERIASNGTLVRWIRSYAAKLNAPTFTVTIDVNGGTPGNSTTFQQQSGGASVSLPSSGPNAPTKTGYSLVGYSTNSSATTGTYSVTPTSNITYFAIWGAGGSGGSSVAFSGTPAVGETLTVTSGFDAMMGYWVICSSPRSPGNYTGGCSALRFASSGPPESGSTLRIGEAYYSGGVGYSPVGKYITYIGQNIANAQTVQITAAVAGGGSGSGSQSGTTVVAESAKPLPTWAAPILKQIPTLSKTLTTDGGKLALTDGDFSSLKSVTIGGAAIAFSIDAKGDVNIPVPAGKGGTTADLIVTFTGGKMTIQDGIKYVEPVNVAAVREAPIAGFKGKSTKITGALAGSIQYAAQLDKKATTVLCTGYAASKAELATATARAEAACAYATKVNDLLVNKTVKVVVNAKLAKTAAVGIKVHK